MTTLIVDDDPSSLELLRVTLAEMGITDVRTAVDGRDALRQFAQMQPAPDLIVCDVFMPNVDGFEILGALENRGYKGLVVLVSGGDAQMLSLAEDVGGAGPLKVLGALAKPVTVEALASLLGNHLRHLSRVPAAS